MNNKEIGFKILAFKTYYKAIVRIWYCHKHKYIDQCYRMDKSEINLHIYSQILFNKNAKTI